MRYPMSNDLAVAFVLAFVLSIPALACATTPNGPPKNNALADIHFQKSHFYEKNNYFERALEEVVSAIALDEDDHAELYVQKGHLLARLGRILAAIAETQKAIALEPRNIRALTNMAIFHARLGNPEAMDWIVRARSVDPEHPKVVELISKIPGLQLLPPTRVPSK